MRHFGLSNTIQETETAWGEWTGFIFASTLIAAGIFGIAYMMWLAALMVGIL